MVANEFAGGFSRAFEGVYFNMHEPDSRLSGNVAKRVGALMCLRSFRLLRTAILGRWASRTCPASLTLLSIPVHRPCKGRVHTPMKRDLARTATVGDQVPLACRSCAQCRQSAGASILAVIRVRGRKFTPDLSSPYVLISEEHTRNPNIGEVMGMRGSPVMHAQLMDVRRLGLFGGVDRAEVGDRRDFARRATKLGCCGRRAKDAVNWLAIADLDRAIAAIRHRRVMADAE